MKNYNERFKQMEFNHVKEAPIKRVPAKRVNIVSVKIPFIGGNIHESNGNQHSQQ